MKAKKNSKEYTPHKSEQAMIEGLIEGSPEAVGVVVVRLGCGCRKMAAVARDGEPASKIIMFRHQAQSVCEQCKKDNGARWRVQEAFIHWTQPAMAEQDKKMIEAKVLGGPVQ